jgi:hypothetical protein
MRELCGDENPIMKAKLIYDYVQQKSRYVSIQVGRRMEADGCE